MSNVNPELAELLQELLDWISNLSGGEGFSTDSIAAIRGLIGRIEKAGWAGDDPTLLKVKTALINLASSTSDPAHTELKGTVEKLTVEIEEAITTTGFAR